MILKCENKPACGKDNLGLLDLSTNKVHCTECGTEIKKITAFSKNALKEANQVKKDDGATGTMTVKCSTCHKNSTPYLKNDEPFCGICKSSVQVTPQFLQMLKIFNKI